MLALLTCLLTVAAALGAKPLWFAAGVARDHVISPSEVWDIAVMAFVFLVTAVFWCATWTARAQEVRIRSDRD
jgi:hypothetical protein